MVAAGVQLEREKRKTAREERLWQLLNDPNVKRLLLLSLIVAYSTYVTRSEEKQGPVASALAMTLPTVGIPMLAADAGVKDWRALLAIAAASGTMATLSAEAGLRSVGRSITDSVTLKMPGTDLPIFSLAGPYAGWNYLTEELL